MMTDNYLSVFSFSAVLSFFSRHTSTIHPILYGTDKVVSDR